MKTVQIRVNPKFKPEGDAQKKAFEDAKKAEKVSGPKTLPYTTAIENIRNSGGMYEIAEVTQVRADEAPTPAAMPKAQLVAAAAALGIPVKGKTRTQLQTEVIEAAEKVELEEE